MFQFKFLLILMLHSISFAATPTFDLGGVVDFYFEANHAPTSKSGETAFEFSRLEMNPRLQWHPELNFEMRFDLAEERDTSSGYQSKLENAFITWSPPQSKGEHQVGLIRPEWRQREGATATFDNFGDSSKNLARRYNFLQDGDLGYQSLWRQNEQTVWALGFMNGEANKTAEIGPSKEGFIGYFHESEKRLWSVWASYGRVDNIDDRYSERVRGLIRWQEWRGRIRLGIEILMAQDPSSEMEAEKRAEGVTFTELTELKAITTEGGRLEVYYQLTDQEQILLRHDNLQIEGQDKTISSSVLAWLKTEPELFDWGLFYENTLYGEQHSAQSRQIERVRLGVSKTF